MLQMETKRMKTTDECVAYRKCSAICHVWSHHLALPCTRFYLTRNQLGARCL